MTFMDRLALLTPLDGIAAAFLFLSWLAIGWRIEHPNSAHPSVTVLMSAHRHLWMKQFVTREPRIFDSQILSSLRQGTSFFASTSILAIGGVMALIGNTEPLETVTQDLTQNDLPAVLFQLKLLVITFFLGTAFLKFVWANRIFGYCAVMMAAVPNDPTHPEAFHKADQAAALNVRAAINFNRGLRSMYYALTALTWLLGPYALIAGTLAAIWILWSREFASAPREIILRETKL
jgi:uncharacterized membrane protein